jgi:hypothetical protein
MWKTSLLVLVGTTAAAGKRANVLFMMADQLRYDASGYAGNPSVRHAELLIAHPTKC